MIKRDYTLDDVRDELTADCREGSIYPAKELYYKARLWPIQAGVDQVVDDMLMSEEDTIERLICLALEGMRDEWGNDPATSIGRVLVRIAERRATKAYDDLLDECRNAVEEEREEAIYKIGAGA